VATGNIRGMLRRTLRRLSLTKDVSAGKMRSNVSRPGRAPRVHSAATVTREPPHRPMECDKTGKRATRPAFREACHPPIERVQKDRGRWTDVGYPYAHRGLPDANATFGCSGELRYTQRNCGTSKSRLPQLRTLVQESD
jgi:hypothetical protein